MTEPVVVSKHVHASPSTVYSYLTDSDKWATWQGDTADLEPSPGGRFSMTMPDGANARGEYLELVPDKRVVFTWGWVGNDVIPPGSSTVEVDLVEVSDGTMVTLTHHGLPEDEIPLHTAGWELHLGGLADVLRHSSNL